MTPEVAVVGKFGSWDASNILRSSFIAVLPPTKFRFPFSPPLTCLIRPLNCHSHAPASAETRAATVP